MAVKIICDKLLKFLTCSSDIEQGYSMNKMYVTTLRLLYTSYSFIMKETYRVAPGFIIEFWKSGTTDFFPICIVVVESQTTL